MYLYGNFNGGTITDNPLTNSATTINSAAFADLPTVSGSDRLWLVLDPDGSGNGPEIVLVTAHASLATSVTVTRGQQSTTAVEHVLATEWIHAVTATDMASAPAGLIVAKGDLISATGANTPARLAVGSDGLPLVAASAQATGLNFAQLATAGIADNAVTNVKLADNAVNTAEIAANAVTTAKIANSNVTPAKLSFTRTGVSLDRQLNLTIPNAVTTTIPWENELFESPAGWIATPGSTLTVPATALTGNYAITFNALFTTSFTHALGAGTRINVGGSLPRDYWLAAIGNAGIFSASVVTRLAPTDTIVVSVLQASDGGLSRELNSATLAVELITPF